MDVPKPRQRPCQMVKPWVQDELRYIFDHNLCFVWRCTGKSKNDELNAVALFLFAADGVPVKNLALGSMRPHPGEAWLCSCRFTGLSVTFVPGKLGSGGGDDGGGSGWEDERQGQVGPVVRGLLIIDFLLQNCRYLGYTCDTPDNKQFFWAFSIGG